MHTISLINQGLGDKTAKNNNISFVCNAKIKFYIPFRLLETIRYNFNSINKIESRCLEDFATANMALFSKRRRKKIGTKPKQKQNGGLSFIAIACKLR